jgi:hypothetical protein
VSGTGVNETDPIEVYKAALRDTDANINMARQDVIRDTGKLSDDKTKLEEARTAKNDPAAAKAKTDVESDQAAVKQDRERLQKHLAIKIENDQVIARKFDEAINLTREDAARGTRKISDDRAKLDDARKRYVTDEIEARNTEVENDQTVLDGDAEKLNRLGEGKAEYVLELKNDSRHLDEVVKHISEADQVSVADNGAAESKNSIKP